MHIFEKIKNCNMKTTKLHKLLLLLPFFLSISSLASDSLKVKKIEYFEDGKLVRTTSLNRKREKMNEYFHNYNENFDENFKNLVFVFKFKDGRHYSITDYYIQIEGNNVFFYNSPFIGSVQSIERDSSGRFTEGNAILLKSYTKHISSLDSLELIPVWYENGYKKGIFTMNWGILKRQKMLINPTMAEELFINMIACIGKQDT